MKILRIHTVSDAEQSKRCLRACRQQATAHNLAMEYLIEHPDEPLHGPGKGKGKRGLIARWKEWGEEKPWARAIPEAAWQAALLQARLRFTLWKRKEENRETGSKQRRGRKKRAAAAAARNDTAGLFVSRRRQDRKRTNYYRALNQVRRTGPRTIAIPGIGELRTVEKVPPSRRLRSATVIEAKRGPRQGTGTTSGQRFWNIDVVTTHHRESEPEGARPAESTAVTATSTTEEPRGEASEGPCGAGPPTRAVEIARQQAGQTEDTPAAGDAYTKSGQADEPADGDENEWAYRLVEMTTEGAAPTKRQGFGTFTAAKTERVESGRKRTAAIARVRREDSDLLRVDEEWLPDATPTLDYSGNRGGAEHRQLQERKAQPVEPEEIVAGTVPDEWRGESRLSPEGNGVLWTGTKFVPVREHQYAAEEGGATLYAWSIHATDDWRRRTLESEQERTRYRNTVLAVDEEQRAAWNLPRNTGYLVLEQNQDGQGGTDGAGVRNAVPVLDLEIAQLADADALRPETRSGPYYRSMQVGAAGWEATDTHAFTRCERAQEEAGESGSRVIVQSDGLDDGVTRIDGRPPAGGEPIGKSTYQRPMAHQADAPGSVQLDEKGNGYVYDGRNLIRIEDGTVPPASRGPVGMPAWVYGVLAKASPTPRHKSVHGILVQVTAAERKQWNLPDNVHEVLVLRHRNKTDELEVQLVTREAMQKWRNAKGHVVAIGTWRTARKMPEEIAGTATEGANRTGWRKPPVAER